MSIPQDHHYLPEFYLKRWLTSGRKQVCEYSRPYKEVHCRLRYPSETGKQRNLYSLPGEDDPATREHVEIRVMSPLDDAAATALSVIESGKHVTDPVMRDAWAKFLVSQLHRSPARLRYFSRKIRGVDGEITASDLEDYRRLKPPGAPDNPRDYFKDVHEDEISHTRAKLITGLIQSAMLAGAIIHMDWRILRLDCRHGLLTSDDPIMTSNGIGHENSFVMLPISPEMMFIASKQPRVIDAFASQDALALERGFNDAICRQADALVIGSDGSQKRFVANRLGRADAEKAAGLQERFTWKSPLIDRLPGHQAPH